VPCRNFVVMVRSMRGSAVMMSGSEFVVSTRGMPDAVMSQIVVTACVVTKVMVPQIVVPQVGNIVP